MERTLQNSSTSEASIVCFSVQELIPYPLIIVFSSEIMDFNTNPIFVRLFT